VDAASQESTPATGSGIRSNPVDTTPPAAPAGLGTSASESGIVLSWNANSEGDLAGYNVYRSTSANGTFTKLNGGLLSGTSFNDTTAPAGEQSFYRVTAVDLNANESTFAAASATRPNPTVTGPIKINFQVTGSPGVAGYEQDNGGVFANRGNGFTYGWNVNHTDLARDRNKNANQLVDTLVHMRSASNWSINVANGSYTVKISVGDSQYATTNTVNVNGTNYWTNQAQAANTFASKTLTINVTNGKIVVNNGSSADLATRINYIEITPAVAATKLNFQPAGAPTVAGYGVDSGLVFGDRARGLSYGWNSDLSDLVRDRNKNANQLVDTLVHLHNGSTWSINVANGTYSVKVGIGDAGYATNNTINVNGVNYWTNQALGANAFANKTMTVTVSNGKITLNNGSSPDLTTRINYIEITQI
ncbi:MAG: hypothetical protein ABIP55_01135, partial [Tepidisphaeraceae bacterium]